AGKLQRLAYGRNGTDAEALRLDARCRERNEAPERLQAALLRQVGRRDEHRCGAVARLRRVARGHGAGRMKGGSQLRKRLRRGVAPRSLVLRERDLAALVLSRSVRGDRHTERQWNYFVPKLD